MIGLDTNVIARIVLLDDLVQSRAALDLVARAKFSSEQLVVSLSTLLELEWVLRSNAKLTKKQALLVFTQLLEVRDIQIDGEAILEQAILHWEGSNADFAECLFLAQYQHLGCSAMLTFDAKAALMEGVELVASA